MRNLVCDNSQPQSTTVISIVSTPWGPNRDHSSHDARLTYINCSTYVSELADDFAPNICSAELVSPYNAKEPRNTVESYPIESRLANGGLIRPHAF